MTTLFQGALSLLFIGALAGCGQKPAHTDHPDHAPAHVGHAHTAPHGGTLVEVGAHQFNVELVHDAASGTLSLYTLDAHAEDFVRTAMPAVELAVQAGGAARTLTLRPVANAATGETVGATAQYDGQAGWLKNTPGFTGEIRHLDFNGTVFTSIAFTFSTAHDND
jgi:predicted small lipoprotein YifL